MEAGTYMRVHIYTNCLSALLHHSLTKQTARCRPCRGSPREPPPLVTIAMWKVCSPAAPWSEQDDLMSDITLVESQRNRHFRGQLLNFATRLSGLAGFPFSRAARLQQPSKTKIDGPKKRIAEISRWREQDICESLRTCTEAKALHRLKTWKRSECPGLLQATKVQSFILTNCETDFDSQLLL